jgi:hypothetical protein
VIKIDLYHNTTTFIKESKQDRTIERWCRDLGIDRKTLETHPRIQDLRTLLDFDQYSPLMTERDREIWEHAWRWVYVKRLPISVYIQKRLLSIVENCQRTEYILKRKQRQATRASKQRNEIGDHNDEAKGSQSAEKTIIYSLQANG